MHRTIPVRINKQTGIWPRKKRKQSTSISTILVAFLCEIDLHLLPTLSINRNWNIYYFKRISGKVIILKQPPSFGRTEAERLSFSIFHVHAYITIVKS